MRGGRGKRVATWAGVLGVAVLIAAGIALKDVILREWYIYNLEHGDVPAKELAARRLGKLGSGRAVRALLEIIRSEEAAHAQSLIETVCDAIVEAGPDAVHILAEGIASDVDCPYVLCAQLLGRIGPLASPAAPAVLGRLGLEQPDKEYAHEVLGFLAGPEGDAGLRSRVFSSSLEFGDGWVVFWGDATRARERCFPLEYALMAGTALGRLGSGAVPELLAAVDDARPLPRFAAILALAEMRPQAEGVRERIRGRLHDPEKFVVHAAAYALGAIGVREPASLKELSALLEGDDIGLKLQALGALEQLSESPPPAAQMLKRLLNLTEAQLSAAAAEKLKEIRGTEHAAQPR